MPKTASSRSSIASFSIRRPIGTLALALAAGADMKTGAMMANYAAGIVVGMVGTATVSPVQLSEAFGDD